VNSWKGLELIFRKKNARPLILSIDHTDILIELFDASVGEMLCAYELYSIKLRNLESYQSHEHPHRMCYIGCLGPKATHDSCKFSPPPTNNHDTNDLIQVNKPSIKWIITHGAYHTWLFAQFANHNWLTIPSSNIPKSTSQLTLSKIIIIDSC